MYTVSDSYKTKMFDSIQTHVLSGTIDGTVTFSGDDVIGVSYSNSASQKKVALGSVNIGTLKLTFLQDPLNRGEYFGKEISISDGLLLGYDENEEPIYEFVPVGKFTIAEAVWTSANMVEITAYDCISLLDKTMNIDQTSGKLFAFCKYIEEETGASFGLTEEECDALPNGQEIISPYENNDMQTFRDLASALAQMAGGFVAADRFGGWIIKSFDDSEVLSIPRNRRMSGTKFSDFETYYDTVTYTEIENNIVRVIGDAEGLTMNIGSQPFLQYGTTEAIGRRVNNIINSIKRMRYTPYAVSLLPAFIVLDLGDGITFSDDYQEGDFFGAVMNINWTNNKSVKIQSYGENPNLRSGQSKTDKNISGIINKTSQNEVTYHSFANVEDIFIEDEQEVEIASLRFSSAQLTTVKLLHEFIMDMESDLGAGSSYEIKYYLDDELVSYSPYERLPAIGQSTGETSEFSITRDFFYILREVTPDIRHSWKVTITPHGMNINISANNSHVILEGQRLYGETYFDGLVEARDSFSVFSIGYLSEVEITDSAIVTITQATAAYAEDQITLCNIANIEVLTIAEGTGELSPHVFMEGGLNLMSEDSDYIVTEDNIAFVSE